MGRHVAVRQPVNRVVQPPLSSLPVLNQQYQGTLNNLLTRTASTMRLTNIQQHGQVIDGNFSEMQRKGTFAGVIDTSMHLIFTVAAAEGHPSLFFTGSIRTDKYLVGNYCRQDQVGQCLGDYGIWSIAPVAPIVK